MRTQTHSIPMSKTRREQLLNRTFVLRIVPERATDVSRTIELLVTQTLGQLHACIQREFELDNDHLYAFYMSGRAWDKHSCYEGPGGNAERVSLQEAGCKPGKEFLYIFDFGDELRHRISVESDGTPESGVTYPRTLAAIGEPPPQYRGEEEEPQVEDALRPLADEAAAACAKFFEEKKSEPLPPRLQLAERLREALANHPAQLFAFYAYCNDELLDWLAGVIFDLAGSGQADAALRLHEVWTELGVRIEDDPVGSRAKLLLRAGRPEAARAEADRRLSESPEDFTALSIAADVYKDCGDLERAEALCRQYYDLAEDADEFEDELAAGYQLVEVLRARGKSAEADTIEQSLEEGASWADDEDDEDDEDQDKDENDEDFRLPLELAAPLLAGLAPASSAATPVIAPPKIGRNDACPCGSGKKYKKCCGG